MTTLADGQLDLVFPEPPRRRQIVAFSGGKDSTAMILAMRDRGEAIDGLLVTPTGNELPEVWDHWNRIADIVDAPVIKPKGPTLDDRPFKGPNVISHLQAIELAYRGDTWVRPLSWRGNGSIVSCIFDTLVIGPAPNIRPTDGKFAMDEGWEIVKPADLAREAQASDR